MIWKGESSKCSQVAQVSSCSDWPLRISFIYNLYIRVVSCLLVNCPDSEHWFGEMLPGRLRRLTRSSAVLTEIKRQDDSEKINGKMEVQWKIRDTKIHRDATMSQRIGLGESARCSLHRAGTGNSHMSFVSFQVKKKRKKKGSLSIPTRYNVTTNW